MKTRTFLTTLVAAGLTCLTAMDVSAQGGGGGGFGGGGGRGGGRGGVLNQDQMTQISTAMEAAQADVTKLTDALTAAQKEAIAAVLAPNASEATVNAKIDAVTKIQADMAKLRYVKAIKAVVPSITADQKTQMNDNPGGAYNTLFGAGGRGGRGMGMGGGGGFGGGAGGGGRRGGGGGGGN